MGVIIGYNLFYKETYGENCCGSLSRCKIELKFEISSSEWIEEGEVSVKDHGNEQVEERDTEFNKVESCEAIEKVRIVIWMEVEREKGWEGSEEGQDKDTCGEGEGARTG